MELPLDPVKPPITFMHGVARVGKTRIPLATVVGRHMLGVPPEQIVESFPTLDLADVYGVIAYYLRHQDEVHAYVREQRRREAAARAESLRRFPRDGLKERLRARMAELEQAAR